MPVENPRPRSSKRSRLNEYVGSNDIGVFDESPSDGSTALEVTDTDAEAYDDEAAIDAAATVLLDAALAVDDTPSDDENGPIEDPQECLPTVIADVVLAVEETPSHVDNEEVEESKDNQYYKYTARKRKHAYVDEDTQDASETVGQVTKRLRYTIEETPATTSAPVQPVASDQISKALATAQDVPGAMTEKLKYKMAIARGITPQDYSREWYRTNKGFATSAWRPPTFPKVREAGGKPLPKLKNKRVTPPPLAEGEEEVPRSEQGDQARAEKEEATSPKAADDASSTRKRRIDMLMAFFDGATVPALVPPVQKTRASEKQPQNDGKSLPQAPKTILETVGPTSKQPKTSPRAKSEEQLEKSASDGPVDHSAALSTFLCNRLSRKILWRRCRGHGPFSPRERAFINTKEELEPIPTGMGFGISAKVCLNYHGDRDFFKVPFSKNEAKRAKKGKVKRALDRLARYGADKKSELDAGLDRLRSIGKHQKNVIIREAAVAASKARVSPLRTMEVVTSSD
ncbi:hypothetical protein P7C71_g2591, partial [Lecanoromycetidae sp. Uapishka_2]